MKKVSDKVYTDFIIHTEDERLASLDLQLSLAKELCSEIWEIVDEGLDELRRRAYPDDEEFGLKSGVNTCVL